MTKYILSDIFKGDFPVSQTYGNNPQYYSQFGLKGHEGVDFATPIGVPVICPFEKGIILRDTLNDKDYGNFVVIWDKTQKCAVWYCHLSETLVNVGDTVLRGQVVGKTGNTGNSTGPHLHVNFVETDSNGNRLNMNNGYQGFLNILDSSLVQWKLGNQPVPPIQTQPTLPPELQYYSLNWKDLAIKDQLDINAPMFKEYLIVDSVLKSQIDPLDVKIGALELDNKNLSDENGALQVQVTQITKELADCKLNCKPITVEVQKPLKNKVLRSIVNFAYSIDK